MPAFLDFAGSNASGEAGADWDGLEFPLTGNPSQAAGGIYFTIESDGSWNCPVPRYIGTESGNWYTPATTGIGSDYEARFTPTGFTDPASVTTNDAASWESLSSGLTFGFALSGSFASDAGTVLVEVRDAASHTVVGTGTITISIDLI